MTIQDTLNERQKTHGSFPEQATTAQLLKAVMRDTPNWQDMPPSMREALEMDATKTARILHGNPYHKDAWHDKAGYSTLGENCCPNSSTG